MSITEAVQSSRKEAAVLASLMSDLSSFPHREAVSWAPAETKAFIT